MPQKKNGMGWCFYNSPSLIMLFFPFNTASHLTDCEEHGMCLENSGLKMRANPEIALVVACTQSSPQLVAVQGGHSSNSWIIMSIS